MTLQPLRITNSELRTYKRCRRKWWLTHYRRLAWARGDDVAGKPRTLGSRVHEALQVIYTPGDETDPLDVVRAGIERDVARLPEMEVEIRKEADLSRIIVEGYLEWLEEEGADEGLILVAAEESVEIELYPGVNLLGKLDARVQRARDGAIRFMDHKIVKDFRDRTFTLQQDEQMLRYHLLLMVEHPDERVDGAIFNMLRNVKRTGNAKPPFYKREEVSHSIDEVRAFWVRTVVEAEEIERVRATLDFGADPIQAAITPNPTRDCSWDCPFLLVCPMFDDPRSDAEVVIRSYYTESDPLARYQDEEKEHSD